MTRQRSAVSVPPFGPLSSNAQPIVLPDCAAKKPLADVTNEFAHAWAVPIATGTIPRHVGFEYSFPAATHCPAATLRLAEPRSVPFFVYIFTENEPTNVVLKSGGHPASTVPAPMTYPPLAAFATLAECT